MAIVFPSLVLAQMLMLMNVMCATKHTKLLHQRKAAFVILTGTHLYSFAQKLTVTSSSYSHIGTLSRGAKLFGFSMSCWRSGSSGAGRCGTGKGPRGGGVGLKSGIS